MQTVRADGMGTECKIHSCLLACTCWILHQLVDWIQARRNRNRVAWILVVERIHHLWSTVGDFQYWSVWASAFGYGGRNGARLLQQQQQTWGNFLSSGKCEPGFSDEQKIAQILRLLVVEFDWNESCYPTFALSPLSIQRNWRTLRVQ